MWRGHPLCLWGACRLQVALISQERKVFAKGRTDGSSHQLFISIISCMLWSQIMEKLLLPMEILPSLGKKWELEAKERYLWDGNSPHLWACSWSGKEGVVWSNNLKHPKILSFEYNSTMVMCFHWEFTLPGFRVLHPVVRAILRRKCDHGCDRLLLAIYDWVLKQDQTLPPFLHSPKTFLNLVYKTNLWISIKAPYLLGN